MNLEGQLNWLRKISDYQKNYIHALPCFGGWTLCEHALKTQKYTTNALKQAKFLSSIQMQKVKFCT